MQDFLAARHLKERLEEVRTVLVERPASLSVEHLGPALEEVSQGLIALHAALERSAGRVTPEDRLEISQLLALSGRVGALYQQARALYGVEDVLTASPGAPAEVP